MLNPTRASLRTQIAGAFLIVLGLFVAAGLYILNAFERQLSYDILVDTAARLELTAEQMHMQAMNYEKNAPRDFKTYYRDVRIYYPDLQSQIHGFDQVVDQLMSGMIEGTRISSVPWTRPDDTSDVGRAIHELEDSWDEFRAGLIDALGDDPNEPRLEWAAQHTVAKLKPTKAASAALTESLRQWSSDERERMIHVILGVKAATVLVALLMLALVNARVLKPMSRTIEEFKRIADGDFGHTMTAEGTAEMRELAHSFNRLSARLHLLFALIEQLQHGNDVDEVVGFLSREFPELLRFDWIGVVLANNDGSAARLETSRLDGEPETGARRIFRLQDTLLERALTKRESLHIVEMARTAADHPEYEFLRDLTRRGLNDAVFLPLPPQSQAPTPAVVVFATREACSYDPAHLRFLDNIAQLVTMSFGRTMRLVEQSRLGAVGEFASGIAHEIRSPLATVKLALSHLAKQPLEERSMRRVHLANGEAARMERLIQEMLLYAKPLELRPQRIDVAPFVEDLVEEQQQRLEENGQRITVDADGGISVIADPDRLKQILVNVLNNACDAAPQGATLSLHAESRGTHLDLVLHNPGPPIPAELLERITAPFVSTKSHGTGLGLAIVKRLVDAHGGELSIDSNETHGTTVQIVLPDATTV